MEVWRFDMGSTTVSYLMACSICAGTSFIHHSSVAGGIDEFDVQFVSK